MIQKKIEIIDILKISVKAGHEILQVYDKDFKVEYKDDKSPLTEADKRSNEIILNELNSLFPEIPILSEESKEIQYNTRKGWECFWLIDPLDGTKEFVKKNGEFTVNIALIRNGKPVLGVIYVPAKEILYFAQEELGAYKVEKCINLDEHRNVETVIQLSQKLPIDIAGKAFTIVGSRSHMSEETLDFIKKLESEHGKAEIISIGSSLKLCLVAEGKADIYPRFGPTMEWDTAAGQAIVEISRGKVTKAENNEPLEYNKENLLNPWFIVQR